MSPRRSVFVGCCKEKLPHAAPARELYLSPLFRLSLRWAEANASEGCAFILSAKYGLVRPDAVIEPYDLRLEEFSAFEMDEWMHAVHYQYRDALGLDQRYLGANQPKVTILAGPLYAALGFEELMTIPQLPLDGMPIGKRLQWLKRQLGESEAA